MAPPTNITYKTLTGRYVDAAGAAMSGTVTFTPLAVRIVDAAENTFVATNPVTATLDANGAFSASLMVGNDSDVAPSGWSYEVRESLTSPAGLKLSPTVYAVALVSAGGATITLSSLTPTVPPAPALTGYVRTINGVSGDVVLSYGDAAELDVGIVEDTVAAGDDARFYVDSASAATAMALQKLRHPGSHNKVVIAQYGDSTSAGINTWTGKLLTLLGAEWPAWTTRYYDWSSTGAVAYSAATTVSTGTGSGFLDWYNMGISGSNTPNVIAKHLDAAVTALFPDLIIIGHGHNEASGLAVQNYDLQSYSQFANLIGTLRLHHPTVPILIVLQNPVADSTNLTIQRRQASIRRVAADTGVGLIDVTSAFLADSRWVADPPSFPSTLMQDTVHPNATGHQLWAEAMMPAFTKRTAALPVPVFSQQQSSLLLRRKNLLVNGDFAAYTTTPGAPDGWTAGGSPTITKSTAQVDASMSTNAYSVRIVGSGSAPGYLEQAIPTALVAGQTLSVTARQYVPASSTDVNSGRVEIVVDGVASGTSGLSIWARDGWFFRGCHTSIASTATTVLVRIHGIKANAAGETFFSEVTAALGSLPTRAAVSSSTSALTTVGDAGGVLHGSGPVYNGKPTIVTHFGSGHGWTFNSAITNGGTSNLNDTSQVGLSSQSIKAVTVGGSGTYQHIISPTLAAVDMTGKKLRVTVRVDNMGNLPVFQLYAAATGGIVGGNYYLWNLSATGISNTNTQGHSLQPSEWYGVEISFADVITVGTPTKTAITEYKFVVADNGGTAATLWLGGIDLLPTGSSHFGTNGTVVLCFDDGASGQWTYARKRLADHGFKATFLPVVDLVTAGTAVTLAQFRELQDVHGHEVGAHAYTVSNHNAYSTLSAADAEADMLLNLEWLHDNGFTSRTFAYPLGAFGTHRPASARTWRCARSIDTHGGSLKHIPTPAVDLNRLRSLSSIGGSGGYAVTNLTAANGQLDKCKANNSLLILTLHQITAGAAAAATDCSDADLGTLLDAITTKEIAVATLGQVIAANS